MKFIEKDMFDHHLFFGLPLFEPYLHRLNELPAPFRDAFIQDQSTDYLQQIENEGIVYVGKCINPPLELASLDSLEIHIYSILKKLIPDYPFEQHPLIVLAILYTPNSS